MPVFNTGTDNLVDLTPYQIGTGGDPNRTAVFAVPNQATQILADVINATWRAGSAAKVDFEAEMDAAKAAIEAILASPGTFHVSGGSVSVPTITAPNVTIPTNIDTSTVLAEFEAERVTLVDALYTKLTEFRTAFYPTEQAAYTAAETWLKDAIANPSGLPPTVIAQLIGDEQARAMSEKVRAQDAVITQFAARRFPLPPDAAASAIMQIEQKAQDVMAEASRKLTAMSVDLQKFNVEKLLGLRESAMDATAKYLSSVVGTTNSATQVVGIGIDAQSKLIGAAADFYRADAQAKDTLAKIGEFNTSTALEVATKNQAADLSMLDTKVKTLMAQAQAVAQMTTALFNNLHVSASIASNGGTVAQAAGTF